MAPLLRVRGPKLRNSKHVVVSNEYRVGNGSQESVLKVVIRLPPHVLEEMEGPKYKKAVVEDTDIEDNGNDDLDITDFSDDLLSLDMELNKILSSTTTAPTNNETQSGAEVKVKQEIKKEDPVRKGSSNEPEYRTIPKNLTTIIQKELLNDDEDIGMIEKMIFSLKDPISATKISLPVKSTMCMHFECFDFENFCMFSHIPDGIKYVCRKDLVKKNFEKKKTEKREQEILERIRKQGEKKIPENELWRKQLYEVSEKMKHQRKGSKLYKSLNSELQFIMNKMVIPQYTANFSPYAAAQPPAGRFAPTNYPTYKCPICDRMFSLNQLYISDAYNFFVKTTPREVNRVELVDLIKYRILDDRTTSRGPQDQEQEVIVLSDDEDEEGEENDEKDDGPVPENGHGPHFAGRSETIKSELHERKEKGNEVYNRNSSEELFDDGLDEELLSLGTKGIGSWEDPVTIE